MAYRITHREDLYWLHDSHMNIRVCGKTGLEIFRAWYALYARHKTSENTWMSEAVFNVIYTHFAPERACPPSPAQKDDSRDDLELRSAWSQVPTLQIKQPVEQ